MASKSATALLCTPCSSEPAIRCGVPQRVDADPLDPSDLRRDIDDSQEVARIDGSAEVVREHQPGVPPLIPRAQLLGSLGRLLRAQQRNDRRGAASFAGIDPSWVRRTPVSCRLGRPSCRTRVLGAVP
jgi:hypothetical protein